jgi:hypothetical protein
MSGQGIPFQSDVDMRGPAPWTATPHVSASDFTFTIFGDRTGMAYPGAMQVAIRHVNDGLNGGDSTSFVLSVGDNIEGYSRNAQETAAMWNSFDELLIQLPVPFLRLPGNHDISDPVMDRVYRQRYGRPYYAFSIQNVLFLMLDTEDGPPELTAEREAESHRMLEHAREEGAKHPDQGVVLPNQPDPCNAEATHASLGALAETHISRAQLDYFRNVLAQYPNARQVLLFMHRPPWREPRSVEFVQLEQMLQGRRYTVFAGHYHQYTHENLHGADYYIVGPTAALPRCVRSDVYLNQITQVHVVGDHVTVERVMLPVSTTTNRPTSKTESAQ